MDIIQLAEIIIGSIVSLGVLIAGAGYGFGKFYEGSNKSKKDGLDLFNAELQALRDLLEEQKQHALANTQKRDEQIKILEADIKKHTQEIGRLQGVNEEKEKKIRELTDVIANRDPQLTDFIKTSMEANKVYKPVFDGLIQDVKDIKSMLGDRRASVG